MSLFEELKRRNVFRVGAAYVVIAWLLLQVAVSAISRHADFRVLYNGSALQSGTRSCGIVYNGSRPISELDDVRAPGAPHAEKAVQILICIELHRFEHS